MCDLAGLRVFAAEGRRQIEGVGRCFGTEIEKEKRCIDERSGATSLDFNQHCLLKVGFCLATYCTLHSSFPNF